MARTVGTWLDTALHQMPGESLVLVFGQRGLLLLGPAAKGLLDISAGLLVPLRRNVSHEFAFVTERLRSQRQAFR